MIKIINLFNILLFSKYKYIILNHEFNYLKMKFISDLNLIFILKSFIFIILMKIIIRKNKIKHLITLIKRLL